jgi:hypothetical protein
MLYLLLKRQALEYGPAKALLSGLFHILIISMQVKRIKYHDFSDQKVASQAILSFRLL